MKTAEEYVKIIMRDETEKIASEASTVYENARIERIYEFDDGAVMKYEWHDIAVGDFNHRFTLMSVPKGSKESTGVVRVINY